MTAQGQTVRCGKSRNELALKRGCATIVAYRFADRFERMFCIVADEEQAAAVAEAVRSVDPGLPVMGLPGSLVLAMARDAGLPVITEAFADRGYRPDGTLVPRSEPGALLTDSDEIARRVVELVTTGRLTAVDGSTIVIEAESVCLHGDTPGAVEHARTTRAALLSAGVSLAPITRH